MIEYVRDPAWQFVGALLALLALAAAVIIYFLQKSRKRLSYSTISNTQLLTVREELEKKLEVLYDGQPARDISLLVIAVVNSGNVPIAVSDFNQPLLLSVDPQSKILSAAVTDVEPNNLQVVLRISESAVEIDPVMLNAGDSLRIKLLVSDLKGQPAMSGRILGVKEITNASGPKASDMAVLALSAVSLLTGAFLMFKYNVEPNPAPPIAWQQKLGGILVALAYFGVVFRAFRRRTLVRLFEIIRLSVSKLG